MTVPDTPGTLARLGAIWVRLELRCASFLSTQLHRSRRVTCELIVPSSPAFSCLSSPRDQRNGPFAQAVLRNAFLTARFALWIGTDQFVHGGAGSIGNRRRCRPTLLLVKKKPVTRCDAAPRDADLAQDARSSGGRYLGIPTNIGFESVPASS